MSKPETPEVRITVANFDSRKPTLRVKRNAVTPDKWKMYTSADYEPRGNTPLLDAMSEFIGRLEDQRADDKVIVGLLCDESGSMHGNEKSVIDGVNEFVGTISSVDNVDVEAGNKVIAVILTDGYENASSEVTSEQIKKLTAKCEKNGWSFIYLGANQDAWGESQAVYGLSGASTGASINYVSSPMGTSSAMSTASYRTGTFLSNNAMYDSLASTTTLSESGVETDQAGNLVDVLKPESK